MRKKTIVLYIVSILTLTTVIAPIVSAQPMKPLRCEIEMDLSWTPFGWDGEISGDIDGDLWITPLRAVFPGITEHYQEEWFIETAEGTITVYQEGVWSFKSFKFKSNGYVSAATGDWAYLEGARVHVRGVTTPFDGTPGASVHGDGTVWICGLVP